MQISFHNFVLSIKIHFEGNNEIRKPGYFAFYNYNVSARVFYGYKVFT